MTENTLRRKLSQEFKREAFRLVLKGSLRVMEKGEIGVVITVR
jgi:transposase-like protein